MGDLAGMLQVGLLGYAVGGAFLSLSYWDMPYNIMAIAGCAVYVTRQAVEGRSPAPARVAGGAIVPTPR